MFPKSEGCGDLEGKFGADLAGKETTYWYSSLSLVISPHLGNILQKALNKLAHSAHIHAQHVLLLRTFKILGAFFASTTLTSHYSTSPHRTVILLLIYY